MTPDPQLDAALLTEFKAQLTRSRIERPEAWASSSRLVGQAHLCATLPRLVSAIQASSAPPPLRQALLAALQGGSVERVQDLSADRLTHLTGLPATKAVRSLCVLFKIADSPSAAMPVTSMTEQEIEAFVRANRNPYDLLLQAEAASLLDLGAGDLTFADEVVARYLPPLQSQGNPLALHCVDRIDPSSKLAGPLQADPERLARLRGYAPGTLDFRYWGNQDCFDLRQLKKLLPYYTIVTCNAPPTPAVAYEPSRLSASVIEAHLRKTKGHFRKIRVQGEEALEVLDGDKALLFPPWKFDIKGPLALLELMAGKGQLCVLGAVDNEVFWEILAQLPADERCRPADVIFTQANLPKVFGSLYARLSALPVGQSLDLASLTNLRQDFPRRVDQRGGSRAPYRFRHVEIRRGATFEGLPAGRTARLFKDMKDEASPWFLLLVPEHGASSQ
ncbi:MAG: hypothetical protein EPO61_12715 [Nitrospirae bacterium]|nr:MAG: hypothetical protein EPO61_12715 [Nitrospirota bacterium]